MYLGAVRCVPIYCHRTFFPHRMTLVKNYKHSLKIPLEETLATGEMDGINFNVVQNIIDVSEEFGAIASTK